MSSTINLPQLILVLLLSILAIRYFFFSPSPSSPSTSNPASTSTSNSNHANHASNHERINPQHVDQLASMFPQVSRRDIMWDLQRNGGSVAATSERILGGGGLDFVRFPSFLPFPPPSKKPQKTTKTKIKLTPLPSPQAPSVVPTTAPYQHIPLPLSRVVHESRSPARPDTAVQSEWKTGG